MLIKNKDREKKQIANNSFGYKSNFENKKNSVDIAKINGRFPDEGWAINNVCQEIYYVIQGSGKVFIEGEIYDLEKNDTFIIESGKKYSVVGDSLTILCSVTPAWYSDQFEIIK